LVLGEKKKKKKAPGQYRGSRNGCRRENRVQNLIPRGEKKPEWGATKNRTFKGLFEHAGGPLPGTV